MRKKITVFSAIVFATLILTSCADSFESDVKKGADLMCKSSKLSAKVLAGDQFGLKENIELMKESEEFFKYIDEKYTDKKEKEKISMAILKEFASCK